MRTGQSDQEGFSGSAALTAARNRVLAGLLRASGRACALGRCAQMSVLVRPRLLDICWTPTASLYLTYCYSLFISKIQPLWRRMGQDEKALIRLWQKKRGEIGPERAVPGQAPGHPLDGGHPRWRRGTDRGGLRGQVRAAVVVPRWACGRTAYFRGFFWVQSRSLTPGPPPFSSMNSTPAFSRTRLMFESVSGSPAYRPTSRLVTVLRCKPVASARSRTVQFNAARAIRTCALVTVIYLCYCHMCQQHMLITKERDCHA
jgi:hypothetical protein